MAKTLYQKILQSRTIATRGPHEQLLYVDRHYIDETCFTCFDALLARQHRVRRPDLTFAFADHTVPTRGGRAAVKDSEISTALDRLIRDTGQWGIELFGVDSPFQGIAHVSAPEQGLSLPGLVVVGSDSHMPTHGALGALGIGIGLSEQTHVLATQTIWHKTLTDLLIRIEGHLSPVITAKDIILGIIGEIGASGAAGCAIEFGGGAIADMSMEQRMTLCNMAVEAGARAALVSPDKVMLEYLANRVRTPKGEDWDRAVAQYESLSSDSDAFYDKEFCFNIDELAPMVTWGNSPQDVVAITGRVPDLEFLRSSPDRQRIEHSLKYMGIAPGQTISGLAIDKVFIGSCTNGRIEDLRLAASVVCGRQARVPTLVVPGSQAVKRQAEHEGLDQVFLQAGMQWRDPGCSMCVAMNGDKVLAGERCASTSNRNFMGRQGAGSRTHLMSPAMAAAASIAGYIVDVREQL